MTLKANQNEIQKIIQILQKDIKEKNIVLLIGDLASGKTTLVKEFVKSLNINNLVTSPTFSIEQIYTNNQISIYHYDLYNKTIEDFVALGLLEEFEKDGIHFIEWADDKLKKILEDFGYDFIQIKINKYNHYREYIIQ